MLPVSRVFVCDEALSSHTHLHLFLPPMQSRRPRKCMKMRLRLRTRKTVIVAPTGGFKNAHLPLSLRIRK
ncbi:hypothetical protein BX666DRAFT_1885387 [Dichotomocladium elegans]|nr:hypothetical protein BX666DRAFT_1885387 [Dichotomocladium elegans]